MSRLMKKTSAKSGLPPGSLVYIGDKKEERPIISIINYNEKHYSEEIVEDISQCAIPKEQGGIAWINIDGIEDTEFIQQVGNKFNLNYLLLEGILNTDQRPRFEDYEEYIFILLKMFYYDMENRQIVAEHVGLVFGDNYLISFQERKEDVFEPIRNRIRKDIGRIRKTRADYLAYALIDAVVDNYFVVMENIDYHIEEIEEKLITAPTPGITQKIHDFKREMLFLRKSAWPLREVVGSFERSDSKLIHQSTGMYLRDLYDHVIQVIEYIEIFQDMLSGLLDLYLSSVSNRMNEIMKVLTIISTIFIPLTFVAGVYGMNFTYMPELEWRIGYPAVWAVMVVIAFSMVLFFKRKKWL